MKALKLILLLFVLTTTAKAQTETFVIKDYSIPFKTTEVKADSFRIKQAVNAYDLALNLSYFHHISQSLNGEYLTLPIVSINDKSVDEKLLKTLNMSDIQEFQFESGFKTIAMYGARGQYGHLRICLEDDKKNK